MKTTLADAIRAAVEEERQGLRTTLRLCVQTFDQALARVDLSADLRVTMRTCRGLCLAALEEGGDPPGQQEDQLVSAAKPRGKSSRKRKKS
jgi:hypothetical protein